MDGTEIIPEKNEAKSKAEENKPATASENSQDQSKEEKDQSNVSTEKKQDKLNAEENQHDKVDLDLVSKDKEQITKSDDPDGIQATVSAVESDEKDKEAAPKKATVPAVESNENDKEAVLKNQSNPQENNNKEPEKVDEVEKKPEPSNSETKESEDTVVATIHSNDVEMAEEDTTTDSNSPGEKSEVEKSDQTSQDTVKSSTEASTDDTAKDTTSDENSKEAVSAEDLQKAEKKKRSRPNSEKRTAQTPIALETRLKSKRPRRTITPADRDISPSSTPKRTPKSITAHAAGKKKAEGNGSDQNATPYHVKGEVLAVRNEDGGFYLCVCPNNIFTISKPFRIQWLDKCEDGSNKWKKSYFDYLHTNSVLYSGVVLKKTDNLTFELPSAQEQKIKRRLQKSLTGDKEISSDSDDDDSGKRTKLKKAAKQKVASTTPAPAIKVEAVAEDGSDGDDDLPLKPAAPAAESSSKSTPKTSKPPKKQRKISKEIDATKKLGKIQIPGVPSPGIKRKSQKYEIGISNVRSPKSQTPKSSTASPKPQVAKTLEQKTPKKLGRPKKTDSTPSTANISSSSDGAVKYMINPEVVEPKSHKSNDNLVPNQAIDVAIKDPAFDLRHKESHLPKDKLAIRAAIIQDVRELETLFNGCSNKAQVFCKTRAVDVPLTVFHYALLSGNTSLIRSLATELSKLASFTNDIEEDAPRMLKDSGDAQNGFKGEELSAIDISKGMKEGNHAFLKDMKPVFLASKDLADDIAYFACSQGLSVDILSLLMDVYPRTKLVDMRELLFENIYRALDMGHVEAAQFLIRASRLASASTTQTVFGAASGSPTNSLPTQGLTELHELALCSDEQLPSQFTIKDAKRRSGDSYRFQAVHCAACNSSAANLKHIIKTAKECLNTMDGRNRRPIHYAAAASTSACLEYLKGLVSIEEQDVNGMTPLMIAAEAGRDHNVDVLLRSASHSKVLHLVNVVERPDRSNRSAVHYAAINGHSKVIDVLAKYKADLDKPLSVSKARATPLMLAAANGHVQTCMSLVEGGASIENRDKLQRTALIHAAMNGHYPVITYLLRKGADPNTADTSNNTAIHYAAAYGWYHCVNVLLQASSNADVYNDRKEKTDKRHQEKDYVCRKNALNMPPIGVALLKDHRDVAQILSEHQADANFRDERGRNLVARLLSEEPLTWKLVDRISFLIENYKADVNSQDVQGMGPIHNLAANSVRVGKDKTVNSEMQSVSLYIAELLLDRGAELNMSDYRGRLPLYFAVEDMNVALTELFVQRGTQCPRSINSTADNVLHMLAKNWDQGNMADIVFGFVNTSNKAVQDLAVRRNKFGFTPLLLLTKTISEHTIKTSQTDAETIDVETKRLVKKFEDLACPLLEALILAAKSDVSAAVGKTRRNYRNVNDDGKTAAHYLSKASMDKECKVLSCLLRHKPKLDILDTQGASPLVTAILNNNCRAVKMLLDVGAQPNFCSNNEQHTYPTAPLILAVSRHGPGDMSLLPAIRALLRNISDIKLVSPDPRNGRTALMCAVEKEEELDLVNALLEKQASLVETDAQGRTPLHLAVNASGPFSALFDIPDLLIEKGASLTVADMYGRIPLHYAYTKIGKDDIVNDQGCDPIELTNLLTSGMSREQVDTSDNAGRTPLHEAARRGAMICCMHLVERGANINRQDNDCNSPLSLAVKAGHNSCAVMLIQKGANVNTNVITIPSVLKTDDEMDLDASLKWQLKSSIPPPAKPTSASVFKVVVEKGWQGVTYVMLDRLEACGVSYASAVESAMRARKYQVVLSLLRKQRDSAKLCEKNNYKQNLLHVLAINRPENTDVQIKVAKVLIDRGVPSYTTDEQGCTPLHYAAFTKNLSLIKFFVDRNPSSFRGLIGVTDCSDRNAFCALLWNSVIHDDVSVQIMKLFLEHDKGSGAINRVCKFPVVKSDMFHDDNDPAVIVNDFFNGDIETITINPLVRAIQLRAHKVIDLLLDYNVDINMQVEGLKNQTPLMLAVQQNDDYVVKKLLSHKTPVLLSALDNDERTVLHHAAKPLPYGYWENMDILRLLIDQGVPVQQVDCFGNTALDYALQGGSGRLSDELQSASEIPVEEWRKCSSITAELTDNIEWATSPPEYDIDAVTILDRIREDEMESEAEPPSPNPDILSGLRDGGKIVFDPNTERHCDVFLLAVDVQQTGNVQYNFFRMQVIHQKGKDLYMFFMRWGLIGERGNWQTSPFNNPVDAIKEFSKYFKLKTANEWRSVNNFKPQTRKYHLVAPDVQRQRGVADLEFDLQTDIASQLTTETRNVFADMINIESMKEAMKESTNVDPDVMPFGRLENHRLTCGIEVLNEIKDLLHTTTDLKTTDPQDQIRLQRTLEKIQQKSTEYYRVLPPRGGIFDRIRPINNTETLSMLLTQSKRLAELEFANKVLLGAQYRINEMNPLDYVYRSVGCCVQIMKPDSDESQYLLQCIRNTGGERIKVDSIYRVSRPKEASNIVSTGMGNYKMLWYGTNILNLMSIMRNGLQPTEAPCNQNVPMFGKGIYLSDMAGRCVQDCKTWGSEKKYMLLCQVALGNVKEMRETSLKEPDVVANSVMAVGKYIPTPGKELILPEGGAISLGEKIKNPDITGVTNTYNEYVVYSPEQVCLRYLVRYETLDEEPLALSSDVLGLAPNAKTTKC